MSGKALWETAHTDLSLHLKLLFKHGPIVMTVLSRKMLNMCVSDLMPVSFCDPLFVCVRVYCFFKGSECGGLPSHRMSAVVQLWSTARACIWNSEKIHQGYSLSLFCGPVFHRFVCTCVFWVKLCMCVCVTVHHNVGLSAPDIFKAFWPRVMSAHCISRLKLDDRSEREPMPRTGKARGMRGERQGG